MTRILFGNKFDGGEILSGCVGEESWQIGDFCGLIIEAERCYVGESLFHFFLDLLKGLCVLCKFVEFVLKLYFQGYWHIIIISTG